MPSSSNPLLAGRLSDVALDGAPVFISAHNRELDLFDAPIDPSWILSGSPRARAALHSRSADDAASTTVWECTAGAFRWHFGWEETVMILDGGVRVSSEDGLVRTLGVGDVAYFAAGTWATWEVETYVRKLAFCRRVMPNSLQLALKWRDSLRDVVKSVVGG